jgi:hypothetical protein
MVFCLAAAAVAAAGTSEPGPPWLPLLLLLSWGCAVLCAAVAAATWTI